MATGVLTDGPVPLDSSIYPAACIEAAAEAYKEFLSVEPIHSGSVITIVLTPLPAVASQGDRLRKEFLNYLLDLSVQYRLGNNEPA